MQKSCHGSELGPLLFGLPLPDWIKKTVVMLADDVKVWTAAAKREDADSLQQDLGRLGD